MNLKDQIFKINSDSEFNAISLEMFNYQYKNNAVYHRFCNLLKINPAAIKSIEQIPFLPVTFFKNHSIKTGKFSAEIIFLSSGTTGKNQSKHYVKNLKLYENSFNNSFQQFYGNMQDYCILALLPSYMEREGSSLIYMAKSLIKTSQHPASGFYLNNFDELVKQLQLLEKQHQKTILLGVSFALLALAEKYQLKLKNTIIMETGGMKGKRKELTREELHAIYKANFGVKNIHSEYGMTELLSQAYSKGNGIYECPNWMKILTRDIYEPTKILNTNATGGINVIDLANIDSCCFIATQDLGKNINKTHFKVLGRFDNSNLRGCNLLIN